MEFVSKGDRSFLVRDVRSVALNPEQPGTADVSLFSRRVDIPGQIVNGPGEFEVRDVLIATLEHGGALAHAFDIDGINVFFVDGPAPALSEAVLQAIGRVSVLIVHVDETRAARQLVDDLLPRTVIAYGPAAADLCASLGARDPEPQARVVWNPAG